jgi:hypothetical protein
MKNSELYIFFQSIDEYSSFERKQKIRELTNNLDLEILFDLRREFYTFYAHKINENLPEAEKKEHESFLVKKGIKKNAIAISARLKYTDVDNFLANYDFSQIEDIVDRTGEFLEELDEIIEKKRSLIRKEKKLEKAKAKEINKAKETEEEPSIDLSGSSIGNKILYLHKLGVIDFLRESEPFNMSVNKLATILSAITDVDAKSLQPVLNPLITETKEIINKNNPYYLKKNVDKVEQTLIQLGYILKK